MDRMKFGLLYHIIRLIVKVSARVMFKLDIKRHAALPDEAIVFVSNHPSATDPFLLHLHRKMSVMINADAFSFPILGKLLQRIQQIPVAPGGDSLTQAIRQLQAGRSVGIFPEGDFSPEEGLHPPHSGAARLALSTGVPVVPVGVYLRRDWIKRHKSTINGKALIGLWYWRGPYVITLGEPMVFDGDVEDRNHVRNVGKALMARIKALAMESKARYHGMPKPGMPETV
jgi:1-acyl-sn-glycerol-3-phosphate acyltransferase